MASLMKVHRRLFPLDPVMEVMAANLHVLGPILLLCLLANYKSEFRNPYQQRLDDFVNEATILTGIVYVVSG
jgi:hypothetical protein